MKRVTEYGANPLLCMNTTDGDQNPTGGSVAGIGITIAWQNGPRKQPDGSMADPTGAFVEDALVAAKQRLEFFQTSKFACDGNAKAIEHIEHALTALWKRREDREARGVHGAHAA